MPQPIHLILLCLALVSGMVFPAIASYTAVYPTMGALILGAILCWPQTAGTLRTGPYIALGLAFLLLAITLPFVWHEPADLLVLVVLLPIPLGAAFVALAEKEPRLVTPTIIGGFCLIGTIAAVIAALNDVFLLGIERAGAGNNPIHFAGLAVTLGGVSLIGVCGSRSPWRILFLAGPVMGLVAALLSGSRGPTLSAMVLLVLQLPLLIVWFRRFWIVWVAPVVLAAIAAAIIFWADPSIGTRAINAVTASTHAVVALYENSDPNTLPPGVDDSTNQRLAFIRSGWAAFMQSPIYGHGATQLITAPEAFFPERYQGLLGAHLHFDVGDFAVVAGTLGVLAYLMLLLAPFMALRGIYDRDTRRAVLLGAIGLSGAFLTLGFTNAVVGVLPQTALYGLLLGALTALGRNNSLWDS